MGKDKIEYDKYIDFYYSNLLNSLKLFSYTNGELKEMSNPEFNPLFELETEFDYAFMSVPFETIFKNNLIDNNVKKELLDFKCQIDLIPREIWEWEFLDSDPKWNEVRNKASRLLDTLGVTDRKYNYD